jgi:hypothetical protein
LDAGSDPDEVLGHEIADEDEDEQVLLAELPLLLPTVVKAAE